MLVIDMCPIEIPEKNTMRAACSASWAMMQVFSGVVIGMAIAATAGEALAQPVRSQYSAGPSSGANAGRELPFSNNTYRRPVLSPYNQLQSNIYNPVATQNMYQQQILPQLQQQQQQIEQLSQRRQMSKLQNQVQQIGRDTTSRQVDESIRPTGHRATYMNYSHYYQ